MTTSADIIERYQKYVIPTYATPDLVLVKGKGSRVWDATGKTYMDFVGGIACQNVGHCHPKVVEAIQHQAAKLVHVSNLYYNEHQGVLAEKLSSLSLGGKCFFANCGATANEALIKLARLWGSELGKYEIVSMKNSFHGRTLATLAATGQTKYQDGFEPMPDGFLYAELNNLESVKKVVSGRTAAVFVEAIQGEGGVIAATPEFMQGLRKLCDDKEVLLFCDEVQCGMGRTGNWFGFEGTGVKPDAFSLAKSLGSGYPIGAIVTGPKLSNVFQPGKHATTFGGSPLACAAALATIQVIEDEGLVQRAAEAGQRFREGLTEFVEMYEHVTEVRGRGLMIGMVLDQPAKPFAKMLADMGLLALPTGDNVIRFLPPLNIKDSDIEEALDIIDDALADWHGVERAQDENEE
jgi:predicted acetylornithine/succinylornithine family transaminase